MVLPNFLIIGAGRCGTTSVHYTLGQHPQIYMCPIKETNFFSYYASRGMVPLSIRKEDIKAADSRSVKTLEEYEMLFARSSQEIAIGETSPSYLVTPGVPEHIRSLIPKAKLIVVLRQPIEAAYSRFMVKARAGYFTPNTDFETALQIDQDIVKNNGRGLSFLDYARFYKHLKKFYNVFSRDQIKVCCFEDLEVRGQEFYKGIFQFVEIDSTFRQDFSLKYNKSSRPKSRTLDIVLRNATPLGKRLRSYLPPEAAVRLTHWHHKLQSANADAPTALSHAKRRELTQLYFAQDISMLQDLIIEDLSHWLH